MGSDRSADLNPNPLNDVEDQIREVAKTIVRPTPHGGGGGGAGPQYSKVNIRPSVDDLEAIVDTKAAIEAEAAWDDPAELVINALILRAWAKEIERKGWDFSSIGSDHVKSLRMAYAAIRLIPKREPIA